MTKRLRRLMTGIFYTDVPSANKQAQSWMQKRGRAAAGERGSEEEEKAG